MTDTHADAHGHAHAVPKHPYHLVDPSPWPILGSIAAGLLATGGGLFMHGYGWGLMANGFLPLLGTMFVWGRDVIRGGTFGGPLTPGGQLRLPYGMGLVIAS